MSKPLAVAFALALVACSETSSSTDLGADDMAVVVPNNFAEINAAVLQPSCAAFSVCHSTAGASSAGNLNLATDPYRALVGVAAKNTQAATEGKLRVKPCDVDNSFLWIKLNLPESQQNSMVGYGASMPASSPHVPAAQLQSIRDWIARGANEAEPENVSGSTCAPATDGGI